MDPLHRAMRSLRRRGAAEEDGFTLIEVVVATSILFLVMASIAYLGTVAFADVAMARVRQTGTALANQALEQVRALPYDTVAAGLDNDDLAGDPAVTFDGAAYRFDGELLARGDNADAVPLVPHETSQVIDDIPYTIRVYVTHYEDDTTSGALRVTVVVSWVASLRAGALNEAQAQTVLFSPSSSSACQSTATHPFPAPCQPYFYANGNASPGGVKLTRIDPVVPLIEGSLVEEMMLSVPVDDVAVEAEAITVVNSSSTAAGAHYRAGGSTVATAGYGRWSAQADSDGNPSTAPHYDRQPATSQPQTSSVIDASGSNSVWIRLEAGAGDTASAIAAVEASTTYPCYDAIGIAVINLLPCGVGTANQAATSRATMNVSGHQPFPLATIGVGSSAAHVARSLSAVAACPTVDGVGCVIGTKRQTLGPIRLASMPAGFLSLVPGLDYLVRLDDVTTTVAAAAGDGNGDPTVQRSGTIRYWSNEENGYLEMQVQPGVSVPIPPTTIDLSAPTTGVRMRITTDLRTGSTSAPVCASPCEQAEAIAQSPILGTITYDIRSGNVPVARFVMNVDFGTLTANASYKPSA